MPFVLRKVDGRAADAVEELQTAFEGSPGFLGVVHDGVQPVVIVEMPWLSRWEAQLALTGVAVARSCVDGQLLASVLAVLSGMRSADRADLRAGYDVLDDTIMVWGVEKDDLINALKAVQPDAEQRALDALAAGTLRIDSAPRLHTDVTPPRVTAPP